MQKAARPVPVEATTQVEPRVVYHRGFTLIELLVVIGIIVALIAIALPVLSQARERARRATCQSNLRQIANAIQQYVQDNDGRYPATYWVGPVSNDDSPRSWQGWIFPYLKNRVVFRCIDHPIAMFGEEDYTYNARALNVFTPKQPIRGRLESRIASPTTTWVNVDAGLITADDVYHFCRAVPHPSCDRLFIGSTIHGGGGNYTFADGHVQWLLPEAMAEVNCRNGAPPDPHTE